MRASLTAFERAFRLTSLNCCDYKTYRDELKDDELGFFANF